VNKNSLLSIIIPVYNEVQRLPRCVDRLSTWLRMNNVAYEIIAVDNGSTDGTLATCEELSRHYPHFFFDAFNVRGKGLAVRHGMLTASGDYRYMCDVDLSTPAYELERFISLARTSDVVIGSRLDPSRVTLTNKRRIVSMAFHALTSLLVPDIEDTQCGFKIFSAAAAMDIFSRIKIGGLAFDVEVLWLANRLGYDVLEMPVAWRQDADSRVNLLGDSLQMLNDVLSIPFLHQELQKQKLPA